MKANSAAESASSPLGSSGYSKAMNRSGFTLIESLITLAIVGIVAVIGMPIYRTYQIRSDLNLATEQVVQGLSRAKLRSQAGERDSMWGFYVPAGVLYKGESYANRDLPFDEVFPMPSTITTSGSILEVAYSKLEGVPDQTGFVVLTALDGEKRTITVTIALQTIGVATTQDDPLTICHKIDESAEKTMQVPDAAIPAHLAHGDHMGPCLGSSSSSSVIGASSQSSSVQSSVGSSVASSASSAFAACPSFFTIATDGTAETHIQSNVTVQVLGTQITYGAGGPEIPVYLSYTKNGTKWNKLFGGGSVEANDTQTISGIAANSKVALRIRGYYKKSGWLTFDESYDTNDESGHVLQLVRGQSLPPYPSFANQQSLPQIIKNLLDAQGKLIIDPCDILVLAELGTIGNPMPPSADFQDAVVLMKFR